jgi:hypothetical protein
MCAASAVALEGIVEDGHIRLPMNVWLDNTRTYLVVRTMRSSRPCGFSALRSHVRGMGPISGCRSLRTIWMPAYDGTWFDPPAPLSYVTLRNLAIDMILPGMPTLVDFSADVTLVPQAALRSLERTERPT